MCASIIASLRGPAALSLAAVGLLTALCLALPTANSTGDAWYYAACARWGHELAQPHHLLYNYVGWWWLRLLGATGPAAGLAALRALQALNALAAGGCLLALGGLLRQSGAPPAAVPAWQLLVGSCFGLLRFATENEAYVLPLLAALLASQAWVRAQDRAARPGRWLGLAGALAVLACLLHQLMVWWWLGLLLGLRPWRNWVALRVAALFLAPAALVPLAYGWALGAQGQPIEMGALVHFALHDYLLGNAQISFGAKSWLLTAISLVRTVGQVHGNLLPLLHRWPGLGAVALASLALGVYAVLGRRRAKDQPPARIVPTHTPPAARFVRRTHALIGALHLGFAAQAAGNAEFMVMLPALAALALAGGALAAWPTRRVAALGGALLSWNVAFGLVPAHWLVYTDAGPALRARVLAQPHAWFLLRDPNLLRNQLHYFTGQPASPPGVVGAPALWVQQPGHSPASFRAWLAARLAAGDTVYTDAVGGAPPLDRAQLTLTHDNAALLAGFRQVRRDSFPTFFGPGYLAQLQVFAQE